MKIDARWYLTEDQSRVVPEAHPEARWLHWIPGDVVSLEEAERLGAVKAEAEAPAAPPRRKPGRPPATKARVPAENKGRSGFRSANVEG
ncbi:hypothetical protein BJP40_06675 [Streptomyces sp. CC53]|nr:hypothetical protein BJP40_06675 [Streptomyces sp. CC53]